MLEQEGYDFYQVDGREYYGAVKQRGEAAPTWTRQERISKAVKARIMYALGFLKVFVVPVILGVILAVIDSWLHW